MENPQAQMPQGQPGMEQGQAPQQGGQDQQMQQLLQAVQQMIQQGAQPVDVAAELLGQQVPPEVIMQVFVQMGLPEQDAQMAIEQAMQGGQQPQGPGEEQMEGAASNPQEEAQETEGAPMMPPGMEGQPPMAFGGQPRRKLRRYADGASVDPSMELETVLGQVEDMMSQGADARQVMEQIQAAAQQGKISPEVATQVLEQLSGMQQAQNPQGSDMAMTDGSQDPQVPTPTVAAPEANMMKFGGNLKKLMQKAYGGDAIPPSLDSKNYAQERANMFVNSVKNNAFKSSLDDEFPSLSGNNMSYGGDLPKAVDGISMKDGKLTIDPTAYKSESDYKAAIYDWNTNPANKDNQVTTELFTANKWTQQPDANASYKYDPNTKQYIKQETPKATNTNQFQFQEGDVLNRDAQGAYVTRKDGSMMRVPASYNQGSAYNVSQSQINPVQYQDPRGNSLYDQLYMSANPWARLIAGSGNRGYDPRITGSNLPGGMSGAEFLGAVGGVDKLTSGMTGTVGNQTWRLGEAEKFKEGSIWKGNRRKGVRYKIDWGDAAAFNTPAAAPNAPAGPQNNPLEGNSTPMGPQGQIIDPAISGNANLKPVLDAQGNQFISDGSNLMWNSGNMPTMPASYQSSVNTTAPTVSPTAVASTASNPVTVANQNLVTPGQSNIQQPAAEVNQEDNSKANMTVTNVTDTGGIRGVDAQGRLVGTEPDQTQRRDKWDRKSDRQLRREERRAARNPEPEPLDVSNPTPIGNVNPDLALGERGPEVTGIQPNSIWQPSSNESPWLNAPTSTPSPTRQELRQDRRDNRKEMFSNIKGLFSGKRYDAGGQIYSDCPEGMMWSEEQQACVPVGETKPLNANVAIGNEGGNQFTANYSGAVNPMGIQTNQFGVGYQNANTNVNANYDAGNQSIMLQGKKTWDVGNGQLGVSGSYNAPVQGMNRGNFSGNVFYNTELGKGDKAVPVKVNFGVGQQAYGGNVNPQDLANAVALINRAFGGMMPRANNGLDLGSEDANGNKIPDYLEFDSLPKNTSDKNGYLEASQGKKFNVDWNAAADVYATSGAKFANFMDKVSSYQGNQERELAKRSALNRPSDTYDTMEQGVYDQWGNFKPNDLNNQVLNPTDVYRQNQRQIYAYGGRLYEIGGEVDLDDNEMQQLAAAGFKFSRV